MVEKYFCVHCEQPITEGRIKTGMVNGKRVYLHDEWVKYILCGAGAPCSTFYDGDLENSRQIDFFGLSGLLFGE